MRRRRYVVKNRTAWRTADLRRFLLRAAAEVFDPGEKPVIHVEFRHGRGRDGCSGYAWVNGRECVIRLPRGPHVDKVDVAFVITHEFGHLRGLEHPAMRGAAKWRRVGRWREIHGWGDALPLSLEPPKVKARLTGAALAEKRLANAERRMAEWARRAKRAATAIRKLKAAVVYYRKRIVVLGGQQAAQGPAEDGGAE